MRALRKGTHAALIGLVAIGCSTAGAQGTLERRIAAAGDGPVLRDCSDDVNGQGFQGKYFAPAAANGKRVFRWTSPVAVSRISETSAHAKSSSNRSTSSQIT